MPKHIRQIRIEGNIAYVPLTRGYEAIIDAKDAHLVEGVNWTSDPKAHTVYAYRQPTINGKKTYMALHHAIIGKHDGLEVDHKDGCGLNNRRSNLRVASRSENEVNKSATSSNSSGQKGVSWDAARGKWAAEIQFNGVRKRLGRFVDFDDACAAYRNAAMEMHGAFVRLT